MEKVKWPKKVTNERRGEKMTILDNILHGKVNWIGHVAFCMMPLKDRRQK